MSVMVIGGSGHVGAFVVKELVEGGKKAVSFDLQSPPKELANVVQERRSLSLY